MVTERPSVDATGEISGLLLMVGGPAPGSTQPTTGQVTMQRDDGSASIQTSADTTGKFLAAVPPGRYRVSAALPYQSCTSDGVLVVSPGATADTRVICHVP